jgi:hypothetical protein
MEPPSTGRKETVPTYEDPSSENGCWKAQKFVYL